MTGYAEHIASLIVKSLNGELTPDETTELERWKQVSDRHEERYNNVTDPEFTASVMKEMYEYDNARIEEKLKEEFPGLFVTDNNVSSRLVHRVHFLRTAWFRYAAAIIIIFGIGAYLWNTNKKEEPRTESAEVRSVKEDIKPGSNRALLTLADGRTIILDSAANGQLAEQQGSNIIKKDGQLIYNSERGSLSPAGGSTPGGAGGEGGPVAYNTMSTPRGGQYQLTLADGTKVWLNAASSITYPTAFNSKTREVKITGEAYFEVAKNKEKPFIVNASKESITVLGTSFNVNAYSDEPVSKTSLLEGSIKINNSILKPGEAYTNGIVSKTDIANDVAWKNGYFNFNNASFKSVMRQLERWYDITVEYRGNIRDVTYQGKLSRDLTLTQITEILKEMDVKFKMEGRKLIVQQNQ